MVLSAEDKNRYSRQIDLDGFGSAGQLALKKGSVLVIGAGGLGSPALMYLAGAGIGRIGIADGDTVNISNLHRQVIHTTENNGMEKVESAEHFINQLNPELDVVKHAGFFNESNSGIADDYDFIISAVDNMKSKHYINNVCVKKQKPYCHGGISGYNGQLFTWVPDRNCFCLRCLSEPPSKEPSPEGLLGTVPGIIGIMQASEAIHYLALGKARLEGTLLIYNGKEQTTRNVTVHRNTECPVCAAGR